MTDSSEASKQGIPPKTYNRGDIWMVDFGTPMGTKLGMEHPAVIVSRHELNKIAVQLGRVVVVPGTSTQIANAKGQTIIWHREVAASKSNGLKHTTYFMTEQIRTASVVRLRRLLGALEKAHVREIEDRLCFVLDLFK